MGTQFVAKVNSQFSSQHILKKHLSPQGVLATHGRRGPVPPPPQGAGHLSLPISVLMFETRNKIVFTFTCQAPWRLRDRRAVPPDLRPRPRTGRRRTHSPPCARPGQSKSSSCSCSCSCTCSPLWTFPSWIFQAGGRLDRL